jgi:hypothetical protein
MMGEVFEQNVGIVTRVSRGIDRAIALELQ